MKEYITDGGRRFVKKNGQFTTGNGSVQVSPKQMKTYLQQTGTKLNEARQCSDRLVQGARTEDKARGKQIQSRNQNIKNIMRKYGVK